MLLLTDLADWTQDPLDSLVDGPFVKPGMTAAEQSAADLLRQAFPQDAALSACRLRSGAAPPGWLALAVADAVDFSQYDVLLETARRIDPLPGPIAALARRGGGCHGNRGRPWRARSGNLHLSCALPVDLDFGAAAPAVPALAAVAVCDAIARCAPGLRPRLKWINDILLDGAKFGGVLSAAQTRAQRLLALTFGIGINVAVAPDVAATPFVPRVTCLHARAVGRQITVGGLTLALLAALWRRIQELRADGPQPVIAAYRRACGDLGRLVGVWAEGAPDADRLNRLPPPVAQGRALALTDELALVVEGAAAPLINGRLAYLDEPADCDRKEPRPGQKAGP